MVFYENSGLQNLYDIVRYCQVCSLLEVLRVVGSYILVPSIIELFSLFEVI